MNTSSMVQLLFDCAQVTEAPGIFGHEDRYRRDVPSYHARQAFITELDNVKTRPGGDSANGNDDG